MTYRDTDACAPDRHPRRYLVFGIICVVYFFVYFHRVSTSVIVSDLLAAFHIEAAALGFMSSMYFYLYAFEQPIVGYLTDRLGPGRIIACWTMTAALGCFLFGMAPNVAWASVGRALIGIGVGGVYVPGIKAVSQWFARREFSAMLGVFMAVGNMGAVIATAPLAWAAASFGWRPTFFLIGALTLALAFVTLFLVRDRRNPQAAAGPGAGTAGGARASIIQVLGSARFWITAMMFFMAYGTFVTLQGLWATPFLMAALDIDRMAASKLNMLIPIGVVIGAPLAGWLVDRFNIDKHAALIALLFGYILSWVGMIFFFGPLGRIGLAALQGAMGIVLGAFLTVLWGIVRETTPSEILGLTSGMLNPAPFLGGAVFQVITGAILGAAPRVGELYALDGFRRAFMVCLGANLICLGLTFCLRKLKT